ncbi:succinylglutamate desuccinylase (plasmid) [Deinococcus metallilatus]|uniref:Succinylglutamate desuccinylase n=1 Tax=Deinococcus metallilatus TaxID=1211322 RepID=A0AAJ5F7E4_9DEIO|nr:succinylglutamate desuccinylase/aspartoacylase family protein [Deinococcus metallilatus]MBB5293428.1 hypothetical protein [Deinococcus metallilatus]QBY06521.1 succinylglutamate desuccinylase [Deinococcus metallilatus]RXJ17864.1 succinylglutamate desuccinylase [Deinococcus metallilatus]TLK32136.1 succinylglutamate desuccinylase [Deinococcus metallilatus]GMA15352.1 deacylase [Deinococcus metallilatus]
MQDLIQSTEPGTARRVLLDVPLTPTTALPAIVVRGREDGLTLLVTAGVHGAEYASIEAAYRLAGTRAEELRGTLVVLPIVNPNAFYQRSIYVNPIDGRNLNRMFPGRQGGTYAERLAYWLHETYLTHADAYLDLHGGDLVEALEPFSIYARGHEPSRQLALAFGLPHLVASDSSGMSYEVSRTHGVPAIIAEAGGQGQWEARDVQLLVDGGRRVMAHLGMLGETSPERQAVAEYDTFAWLRASASGLWSPAVRAGQQVGRGETVGILRDLLGRELETYPAPASGVVLFCVSSLAMNEGDPLVGIGAQTAAACP